MTESNKEVQPQKTDYVFRFLEKYPLFPSIAMLRGEEARLFAGLRLEEPILDLGCGNGFFVNVALGGIHSGIDRDFSQAKRAQASRAYRHPVVGDICRLPYKDGSFSTVISNCVLEHVEQIDQALGEVFRILAPSGTCAIIVLTKKFDEWFYLAWLFRKLGMPALAKKQNERYNHFQFHYHLDSVDEWASRLAKARLQMETYQLYGSQLFLFLFSAIDDIQHILGHMLIRKSSSSEGCTASVSERFSGHSIGNFMARLLRLLLLPFPGRVRDEKSDGAAVLLVARKKE